MARIYLSAGELINNKPYALLVPRSYQPNIPQDFLDGRVQPYVHYDHADEPQRANYPIKYMIDMCELRVRFTILNDEDVCDIFDVIDDYLISARQDVACGDQAVIAYVRRMLVFRAELYKRFFYVCNTHYELKRRYFHNKKDNRSLDRVLAALAMKSDNNGEPVNSDPIYLLRYPPIKLPEEPALTKTRADKPTSGKKMTQTNRGLARDDDDESMSIVDEFMRGSGR